MVDKKPEEISNKQFSSQDKAKKGWWFSVFFMILVVCLIMFLSFVEIQEKNRDVLVGMLGMLTGAISSMLAIASGRDPSEVEELKDKLAKSDGDRFALIARLRDSQIQLQLAREQIFELQNAVINKLSIFHNENPIKTKSESQVILNQEVADWLPETDEFKKR
jgi:hypothetical protein|tara:strand:+ start:103 stop:591 length:489 start_codon:yes stop_codon:yes gene_type:complete